MINPSWYKIGVFLRYYILFIRPIRIFDQHLRISALFWGNQEYKFTGAVSLTYLLYTTSGMESLKNIFYTGQVLWSQIDANQHMRHSAYADFAAQARIGMLQLVGLSPETLYRYKIGTVLFR